jgi:hypothetical protein
VRGLLASSLNICECKRKSFSKAVFWHRQVVLRFSTTKKGIVHKLVKWLPRTNISPELLLGDKSPNISRPSTDLGGCRVGKLGLPILSCLRISMFTLSLTMFQYLVGDTLIKTSPGHLSTVTWKFMSSNKISRIPHAGYVHTGHKTEICHKQRPLQPSV